MEELRTKISSLYSLNKAFMRCKSGRLWKPSVMDYYLHMSRYNYILHKQLDGDTYRVKPCYHFTIYEPMKRNIQAPHLTDRIVQSSICNNYLKEKLRYVFIRGNCACQEGKGTDDARNYFKELLRRYYRRYGTDGVVWKIDIRHYFASIDGDCLDAINQRYIQDEWVISYMEQWGVQKGTKGLGLGAETNQFEAALALHPIDTFFKTVAGCKYYVRYQDDIMVILRNKEEVHRVQDMLIRQLAGQKLSLNQKKTRIFKLSAWYSFLGFNFTVTESGKVLMRIKAESVSRQRRRCRHQFNNIPSEDIEISGTCWAANASKGNNYFIVRKTEAYIMEIVREKREQEKKIEASAARVEKLVANQEYIAMMADIDLPEEGERQEVTE